MLTNDVKVLPAQQLLFTLPCLLAIAILLAALMTPAGESLDRPPRDTALPAAAAPQKKAPSPRANEQRGAPTCPSCGQPMVARRNREKDELVYVCKSPDCRRAAAGTETTAPSESD